MNPCEWFWTRFARGILASEGLRRVRVSTWLAKGVAVYDSRSRHIYLPSDGDGRLLLHEIA